MAYHVKHKSAVKHHFPCKKIGHAILLNNNRFNLTDITSDCQPNHITRQATIGNNINKVYCKRWLPKLYLPLDQNGI